MSDKEKRLGSDDMKDVLHWLVGQPRQIVLGAQVGNEKSIGHLLYALQHTRFVATFSHYGLKGGENYCLKVSRRALLACIELLEAILDEEQS